MRDRSTPDLEIIVLSSILSIARGIGNFILELLADEGKHAKAEVVRLFTRREMMDRAFGGERLTSKGEIATRAMFAAAEASFQKSRKPGTMKRRKAMMLDAFGDVILRLVEGLLEEDIERLKKDDMDMSGAINAQFIRTFNFVDYQRRCEEKAPLLWKLIRNLCGIEDASIVGGGDCPGSMGGQKNRDLCAVLVVSNLLHARSEKANLMPKILGLFMAALHVPKRAISLLGRLGITISYTSINRILKDSAYDCLSEVVKRAVGGDPFGIVYDNLVFSKRVSGETVLNKESLEKMTVNAVYFLRINTVRTALYDGLPGLPRDLCLLQTPRGSSVLEVLGWDRSLKYWLKEAESQVRMVLKKVFEKETCRTSGNRASDNRAVYRKIPIHRTDFMVLPTLDVDPGTLTGNVDVVDGVINMLGLKQSMTVLSDRIMPWNGDLFTVAMLNSVKVLRSRDKPENRLGFVDPWPGYLHAAFAFLSGITNLNMGDDKGRDPFSLRLFMDLLGRSKLTGPKPPYHGLHDFVELIRDACIIADAILDLGEEEFCEKLKECDFEALVTRISKRLLDLNIVGDERAHAEDVSWAGIVSGECPLPRSLSTEEKRNKKAEFMRSRSDPQRDLVYENMHLFVGQASIYLAMHEHCRSGDSGGLEENLYLQTMFFHGAKKPKYAKEWLRQSVKRNCFWSAEYREIWYENCLINLTGHHGHFMSLDEACEITVDAIKHDFNPRGSWQSREFHIETVSPNITLMREIRRQVMSSSGASTYGTKHSSVNTEKDRELVVRVLLENKVMRKVNGRVSALVGGERHRFREVIDAVAVGRETLRNKGIPEALINVERMLAEDEEEGDLGVEAELEYYDDSMEGGFIDLDGVHIDVV